LVINKRINKNSLKQIFVWPRVLILGLPVFLILFQGQTEQANKSDFVYLIKIIPELVKNSAVLLFWCLLFSGFFGIFFSVTLSLTNLPGRRYLKRFLYIPLALPLYVSSFIYIGATNYSSDLGIFFRNFLGLNLDLITRNLGPCWIGFVFSLYLSPYISLAMTKAMDTIGVNQWPVAKTLGLTNTEVIKKVLLPGVMPWFISSSMIVSMEVLSDFGGVSAFNYETLSTGIYTAWTGLFNYGLALKISLTLIFFSMLLFGLEKKIQGKKSFEVKDKAHMSHPPIHLNKIKTVLLYIPIIIYFFLTIIAPAGYLFSWSLNSKINDLSFLFPLIRNTVAMGVTFSLFCCLGSFLYSYISKDNGDMTKRYLRPIELMGYSLPGPIIAISFILIFTLINKHLFFNISVNGILVLLLAIFYRFLYVGERNWSSSFERVNNSAINTAKVLGLNYLSRFKLTYLPVFKQNATPIFLLLFLEIIKELPITLMLRPFGLNTLSINIYELTSEGEWERAAISALALLLVGAPIIILTSLRRKK